MRISLLLPVFLALTLMGCDDEPAQPSAPPPPMEQQAPAPADESMPAEPMPSEPMPAEPAPAAPAEEPAAAEDDYQQ